MSWKKQRKMVILAEDGFIVPHGFAALILYKTPLPSLGVSLQSTTDFVAPRSS